MLIYNDYSGFLAKKYLNLPSISCVWTLFEKQNIELMANYLKGNLSTYYVALNHESFKNMNPKLMDYQGAFGLCEMPSTSRNKCESTKYNNSNIYLDVAKMNEIKESELITYLYKVFYNDFGFIIDSFDKCMDVKDILYRIKTNNFIDLSQFNLESISLFIEYDDCFRGLLTFYVSSDVKEKFFKFKNNISLSEIDKVNKIYGCRLAGSIKTTEP